MSYQFTLSYPYYLQINLSIDEPISNAATIYETICQALPQARLVRYISFNWASVKELPSSPRKCWYCHEIDRPQEWQVRNVPFDTGQPVGEVETCFMCHRHSVQVRASLALRGAGMDGLADELDSVVGIETRPQSKLWMLVNSR